MCWMELLSFVARVLISTTFGQLARRRCFVLAFRHSQSATCACVRVCVCAIMVFVCNESLSSPGQFTMHTHGRPETICSSLDCDCFVHWAPLGLYLISLAMFGFYLYIGSVQRL